MTNSPAVGSDPRSAADTPYHRMSSSNEPALRPLFDRNVQQGPTQRLIGGPNDGPPRLFGSATWNQIVPGTGNRNENDINSNNGSGAPAGGGGRTGRGAAWNMDQLVQAAIRLMGLNHAMVRDILIQILLLVAGLAFVFTGDLRSAGICLLLYYAWYLYLQLTYGLAQHLLQNGPPPDGGLRAPLWPGERREIQPAADPEAPVIDPDATPAPPPPMAAPPAVVPSPGTRPEREDTRL